MLQFLSALDALLSNATVDSAVVHLKIFLWPNHWSSSWNNNSHEHLDHNYCCFRYCWIVVISASVVVVITLAIALELLL
jgi:hypothetical protein